MTNGVIRGCQMAPQESNTWQSHVVHLNVWLTISHMKDDVIKGNKK